MKNNKTKDEVIYKMKFNKDAFYPATLEQISQMFSIPNVDEIINNIEHDLLKIIDKIEEFDQKFVNLKYKINELEASIEENQHEWQNRHRKM